MPGAFLLPSPGARPHREKIQPRGRVCPRTEKTQFGALKSHVISSRLFPLPGSPPAGQILVSPLRGSGCKPGVTVPLPWWGEGEGVGKACRCFGRHTLGGVLPASDGWRPGMVLTPCHAQHHPRNAQDHPCNAQDCPCKAQSSPCGATSPINQPHPRVSRAADRTLAWGLGRRFC